MWEEYDSIISLLQAIITASVNGLIILFNGGWGAGAADWAAEKMKKPAVLDVCSFTKTRTSELVFK